MRKFLGFALALEMLAFMVGFSLSATGALAAPRFGHGAYVQIIAEVFLDTAGYHYNLPCPGCNGQWDNWDWCGELYTPLPPVTLILRDAETAEEIARLTARKNTNNGRSWAYFSVLRRDAFLLEVESIPEGFEACPTSSLTRRITQRHLQHGRRLERFYFWWGCPPNPPADDSPPTEPPPPPGAPGPGYHGGCGFFP